MKLSDKCYLEWACDCRNLDFEEVCTKQIGMPKIRIADIRAAKQAAHDEEQRIAAIVHCQVVDIEYLNKVLRKAGEDPLLILRVVQNWAMKAFKPHANDLSYWDPSVAFPLDTWSR